MGNSLFDQLKKQGLVDKKKAQELKHSQYKNKKQKIKKGSVADIDEATLLIQRNTAEKVERDRQLNQQQKDLAERKAITAQIKQLIETNRIEERDGDIVYNFTDANIVKHIYLSAQVHKHLTTGRLAIAKLAGGYELVPMSVADKIKQRDEQCIIVSKHATEPALDEDDPYADYKIPDDLMW